ncbi:xanthine dehydrogenase family protein molybdopterin-binding subunit [Phormidium sp. FACHB-592]|uniref:Xanthine dehydrogenase family protein molybdopterin-binding subunit n=1 Tax=Stenomitos frigidus AS-A4 TaxID=2933935 RepID=A0ABV0KHD2_9CYAN|nr:xanthine dehydrogenase family protein molybdopterin-binding subunit [Phormidium sp. FACHB-592]MBD2073565.1 xanthine dehydrogenase family protein molybdopterin-binding subunit [Phormidium sp. FACHB-592]
MSKVIGTAVNRKDGYAKVTGTATYSAEHDVPGLVHGVVVTSTIAKGRIKAIDTREAEKAPGVTAVFTHKNAPKVFKPSNNFMTSKIYEARLPLSDDQIHYAGQIIGLVVADTFERARYAAHLVKVEYDAQKPTIEAKNAVFKEAPPQMGEEFKFVKGDVAAGMAGAATKLEATYTTSTELHAPMEPHAIIAQWQGTDALTVYEPSQFVALSQRTYAELFGLPSEKVRIIIPYLGGAFGSKAFPWPHGILAAAAARQIKRPLKVVLSRRQVTANAGHRSETEQTVRLAAAADGMLSAIAHEVKSSTSPVETFTEPCTSVTPAMYTAPNLLLNQELAVMNIGTPTFMRAPGEAPGMWALESAMDELAWALKLDPIALRLKNEAKEHQRKGLPFSAKHFADCLRVGAERFGWKDRPEPRSLTRDGKLIGWGMAAATFPGFRGKTSAKVRLLPDGSVHVLTSGNDMGTGSYTVVAITAAETLGVPVEKVRVEMGDSQLPDGGLAGGSQMTASLVPTVMKACQDILKTANCTTGTEACAALQKSGRAAIEASASSAPGDETKKWAFQSWGAHFCEVTVDEEIGRLRVTRWVSVMDVGRIINTKAAASQVRGGVIMGIGQALMEECHFDPNTGYPVVYDLATYHFPAHADTPRIDVAFVGEPDLNFNPAGVRGVGEIGITGVSAAIANAVHHATGKRLRSLPLTPDKLIA